MFKKEGKSPSEKKKKKRKGLLFGIQTSESKEVASFLIYHFFHVPANFTKFLKCNLLHL